VEQVEAMEEAKSLTSAFQQLEILHTKLMKVCTSSLKDSMHTCVVQERDKRQKLISDLRNKICDVALKMEEQVIEINSLSHVRKYTHQVPSGEGMGIAPLGPQMLQILSDQLTQLESRKVRFCCRLTR
jgi:hypothetical protein